MARTPNFGSSKPVSTEDFQERLRLIFERKPTPVQRPQRAASAPNRRPPPFKS